MHVRLTRALVLLLALALVGLGCGKPGAEYLGKWQNTKNKNDQFEIVRNGDNFLVTKSSKSGHGKPTTLSCVLRDGILQSTGGFGTATLTYVKATDRLTTPGFLGGNLEYERVK
ncbi:MAG TPA: hypothetical protein VI685_18285, partial [Candidatus Angelobacter sp.]